MLRNVIIVTNQYGKELDYEATVQFMNDEIREELHLKMAPCTEQEFFDAYCEADPDWFLNGANPVW